jgi:release factor glutamine methyltransferase
VKTREGGRGAVLRRLAARFREVGLDTPELDARLLVLHAAGLALEELVRDPDAPLEAAAAAALETMAVRRLAGEPVARIVGAKEFWGLPLALAPATLVPRPETETVVAAALGLPDLRERTVRILDMGTGSGAILLALLSELPLAWGLGVDRSAAAAAAARANAEALGLAGRAAFMAGDWGAPLAGEFDLLVSNPPYVATADVAGLPPEVRLHDPVAALDGGPDGLGAYRALAGESVRLLKGGGHAVVELGAGQEEAVTALFAAADLVISEPVRRDLAGIPRALVARR